MKRGLDKNLVVVRIMWCSLQKYDRIVEGKNQIRSRVVYYFEGLAPLILQSLYKLCQYSVHNRQDNKISFTIGFEMEPLLSVNND